MINLIPKIKFLTHFSRKNTFIALSVLLFPSFALANPVNVQILGMSNTNPVPGTNVSVTVRFCDDTAWANNRVKIMAAIISGGSATAFSSCPTAGQYMVVDSNIAGSIASTPGSYDVAAGGTGVSGPPAYPSYTNTGAPTCPAGSVTAVWSIYIDSTYLSAGTYSFVVEAAEDYIGCTTAPQGSDRLTFTVPFPPPGITLSKIADGSTANANDLVLFRIDYSYVNTGPVTITDTIPTFTALAGAYFGTKRPPVSDQSGHPFRSQSGHLFRTNPATFAG